MPARVLHILTPLSGHSPASLVTERIAIIGDQIADYRYFPFTVYEIQADLNIADITSCLLATPDYWAVIREWLAQLTDRTGLQDTLSVDGYGFWWTLNSLKFAPALSKIGNAFAWIDLLVEIHEQARPDSIIIYGEYEPITSLVNQVCQGITLQIKPELFRHPGLESRPPRKIGLLTIRVLLGIIYLIYARVRRPDILCFSAPTLLRSTAVGSKHRLHDVYLGDVAETLKAHGWRVDFVETYGWNASWRTLAARGLFFPNDLLFLFGMPSLHKFGVYYRVVRKWRDKWVDVQARLKPHLRYRGYDISQLVLPMIAHEFAYYAPYFEIMTKLWRRIFLMLRPRLLYINAYYGLPVTSAIVAAKTLNIPTIEQQHGAIGRSSFAYLIPQHLNTTAKFPLCDSMLVWGDHFKRLLVNTGAYEPEQVTVCGFPRIDSLLAKVPPRSVVLAQLGIPTEVQIVLYTSNLNAHGFMSDILDSIQSLPNASDIRWIVKLHPREKTRHLWLMAMNQRGLQNVQVFEGEFDFYALLAACDVHVSFVSTTLIEAAVLGKLNIGIKMDHFPDPVGFTKANAFLPVIPSQLGRAIYDVLRDPLQRETLLREQKKFANDWCLHDGKAVERIVHLVEAEMADS